MQKSKKIREPIPEEFASIEEAAEFWQKHDLSESCLETRSNGQFHCQP